MRRGSLRTCPHYVSGYHRYKHDRNLDVPGTVLRRYERGSMKEIREEDVMVHTAIYRCPCGAERRKPLRMTTVGE